MDKQVLVRRLKMNMNVFITGAAGGLGRAMANECGKRGYNIFLTDINETGLEKLHIGLERQYGICAVHKSCDLTDAADVDALMNDIDKAGLKFDMLLNIAGVDYEGAFVGREREQLVKIIMLNDIAALRITHAILARRRPDRRFTAVLTSSLASMYPMPLKATYAASKRFILDFATSLRCELKNQNANVLALCPGGLATTDEAIKGIDAQGFWGDITTNPLEIVAHNAIERALDGDGLYVPGALNRLLAKFSGIIPRSLAASAIHWRWSKVQKKWLAAE